MGISIQSEGGHWISVQLKQDKSESGVECVDGKVDDAHLVTSLPSYLFTYQVHIVDSITSGNLSSRAHDSDSTIFHPLFSFLNIPYSFHKTKSASSIKEIALNLNLKDKHLFLFLSGDTSISEFTNSIFQNKSYDGNCMDILLLPFPMGTGNSFCSSIGLTNVLDSLTALFTGKISHFPIYKAKFSNPVTLVNNITPPPLCNEALFFVVLSWGLHSAFVYEADKIEMRSKYGTERFKIAGNKIISSDPTFYGKIDEEFEPLSYLAITAMPNFEPSYLISPNSIPDKDELHLVKMPHLPPAEITKLLISAYDNGSHLKDARVEYKSIKDMFSFSIKKDTPFEFSCICVDGTIYRIDSSVENSISVTAVKQNNLRYIHL
ncbi:hypothetical protein DAMA08_032400 [Martiniozyma asiatica (nom. inval.)]|nr:hypothetical protein DAMA08_032400 [Martiniozyma asiatica]